MAARAARRAVKARNPAGPNRNVRARQGTTVRNGMRSARAVRIPFLAVVPCLALTFLFGPAGFLAFTALRAARAAIPTASHNIGAAQ